MRVREFLDMCPVNDLIVVMVDYDTGRRMDINVSDYDEDDSILDCDVKSWGVVDGEMLIGYRRTDIYRNEWM